MDLPEEHLEELERLARTAVSGGYEPLDQIRAGLLELVEYDPATEAAVAADCEAAIRLVDAIVARHAEAHAREETEFAARTDPERLSELFRQLEASGIAARENVGFTQRDLASEMWELLHQRPELRGFVAFHGQDLERVVDDGVLLLSFAHRSDQDEDFAVIGREVADRAREAGFDVVWNGEPTRRIELHGIRWQRRRT